MHQIFVHEAKIKTLTFDTGAENKKSKMFKRVNQLFRSYKKSMTLVVS